MYFKLIITSHVTCIIIPDIFFPVIIVYTVKRRAAYVDQNQKMYRFLIDPDNPGFFSQLKHPRSGRKDGSPVRQLPKCESRQDWQKHSISKSASGERQLSISIRKQTCKTKRDPDRHQPVRYKGNSRGIFQKIQDFPQLLLQDPVRKRQNPLRQYERVP